jgi:glutathione peroxidase-family protein
VHASFHRTVYDFTVKDCDGKDLSLRKFESKKALLFVNVASK